MHSNGRLSDRLLRTYISWVRWNRSVIVMKRGESEACCTATDPKVEDSITSIQDQPRTSVELWRTKGVQRCILYRLGSFGWDVWTIQRRASALQLRLFQILYGDAWE